MVQTCGACQSPIAEEIRCCVTCREPICDLCTRYHYPNRRYAILCKRCPAAEDAPFPCARCEVPMASCQLEFFCDLCGCPVCSDCLWLSFEGGDLKCGACCARPTRQNYPLLSLRHVLDEAFLSSATLPLRCSARAITSVAATHEGGARDDPSPDTPASEAQSTPLAAFPATSSLLPASRYHQLFGKSKLGEGAQGVVYKCYTADKEVVVSKEMIFEEADAVVFESQRRQVERMRQLNHPHLIRYLDVIAQRNPPRISVIMPYYNEGDLSGFIVRQRRPVPEVKLCSIVLQIAGALQYLHSQTPPLVHRDIKPENILLLNNEDQVLLMDLDLCGSVGSMASTTRRASVSPTYEYRAPELAHSTGSTRADVFSLGVVSYVLATLPDFPFVRTERGEELVLSSAEWSPEGLEKAVRQAMGRVRGYVYSEPFIRLLVRMLVHNPAQRPSSSDVFETLSQIMESLLIHGAP